MSRSVYLLVVLAEIAVSLGCQAQGGGIDSLLLAYRMAADDTSEARTLNVISLYYSGADPVKSLEYAEKGLILTRKMRWDKGIAAFYTCKGNALSNIGEVDSAFSYYQKALVLYKKSSDSVNLAITFLNLGSVRNAQSDFVAATRYYNQSLRLGELLQNYDVLSKSSNNLSLVYQYQKDKKKAYHYSRKAIEAAKASGNEELLISPYTLLADLYSADSGFAKADTYYQRALELAERYGSVKSKAMLLNNIGSNYFGMGSYDKALEFVRSSGKLWKKFDSNAEEALINLGITGSQFVHLARLKQEKNPEVLNQISESREQLIALAIRYLEEAVSKFRRKGNVAQAAQFQEELAGAYQLSGAYDLAFFNLQEAARSRDSIFSQENKNAIARLESQHEIDLKNAEINLQKLRLNEQRKNMLLLIVSLLAVSVAGLLFYRISKLSKLKNKELTFLNQQLDKANKTKAKLFALLTHDLRSPVANLISFMQLQKTDRNALSEKEINEQEEKLARSAENLLEVMEGLLLWSKGQMEQFEVTKENVYVLDLFRQLELFFSGISCLSFNWNEAAETKVYTDLNYLLAIMRNLTQNAVNALNDRPDARIYWNVTKGEHMVTLSVTDNGPGLSAEKIRDLVAASGIRGLNQGMGLHLVQDMAKAIDMDLRIHSESGKGTTFFLDLEPGSHEPM